MKLLRKLSKPRTGFAAEALSQGQSLTGPDDENAAEVAAGTRYKTQQVTSCQPSSERLRLEDYPPLHRAVYTGDRDCVRQLLDAGHSVNHACTLQTKAGSYVRGVTPLLLAVQRRDEPMVQLLLAAGADPNMHATTEAGGMVFTPADAALNLMQWKTWWRLKRHASRRLRQGALQPAADAAGSHATAEGPGQEKAYLR